MLWKQRIKTFDWDRSEFLLEVAGLREDYPRLGVGDLAHLRMVFEDTMKGNGQAFEARIIMIRKREGLIRAFTSGPMASKCLNSC